MIVIVDYKMGNLGSISNMFRKLGVDSIISSNLEIIGRANKLILPGVGAFDKGMKGLEAYGLLPVLRERVEKDKIPVLGICLGMQLLTRRSEEGVLPGLGWIKADTVRFRFESDVKHLKIPHMGWNSTQAQDGSRLFKGLESEARFYFLHSYYVRCDEPSDAAATTVYGHEFVSAVERENVFGAQFHPEKSHKFGLQLLRNFAALPNH